VNSDFPDEPAGLLSPEAEAAPISDKTIVKAISLEQTPDVFTSMTPDGTAQDTQSQRLTALAVYIPSNRDFFSPLTKK
jgi:hypothetical protein